MVREIQLTKGYVTIVDDDNYEMLSKHLWCAFETHGRVYAFRRANGDSILMHRVISNASDNLQVDHKDNNGLNNRKKNLRYADGTQQRANSKMRADNTSSYKGVRFRVDGNSYQARITVNYIEKHLGSFRTAEDAARAYDKAARELFGEYARCNFE